MSNKIYLGSKIFNFADQVSFSDISGDHNPIHINDSFARKSSFGQVVVHGVNAFLVALDFYLFFKKFLTAKLKVKFLKPIYLNEKIDFFFIESNSSIVIKSDSLLLAKITLVGEPCIFSDASIFLNSEEKLEISDVKLTALVGVQNIPLVSNVKSDLIHKFYPNLCSIIGPSRAAQIVCLSSVVGMQVPGMYSLFVSADINFFYSNSNSNSIKINKVDPRFGVIDLQVVTKEITSIVRAIARARPPVLKDVESLVDCDFGFEVRHKHALVIGGSRGIGAACTRMLALRGYHVTFTYNKGYEDALRMKEDLLSHGANIEMQKFDIEKDPVDILFLLPESMVFYFATPPIFVKRSISFESNLYNRFLLFYVDFFKTLLDHCLQKNVAGVFYPSSIAIENEKSDMPEYILAKLKGEEVAASYSNSLRVFSPRIVRVLTDQTSTNLALSAEDPHDILYKLLPGFFEFISAKSV